MVVDDHAQVRHGLSVVLDLWDDFVWVGEAENGEKAVALAEKLHPDIILMDLVMPVMDGATATRIIKRKFPDIQILVLTSSVDSEAIQKAIDAGAKSYMLKNVNLDTMAETIRAAVH